MEIEGQYQSKYQETINQLRGDKVQQRNENGNVHKVVDRGRALPRAKVVTPAQEVRAQEASESQRPRILQIR